VADWATISALATAGGTLVLAATTYSSVRSANRAARVAEQTLLVGQRPLLVQSGPNDPPQRIPFFDGAGVTAPGEGAGVEVVDGRFYFGISLRNVGPGIAVLHGGLVYPGRRLAREHHLPLEEISMLRRDLFVPPGALGFYQIALRDENPLREEMVAAFGEGRFGCEILYGDYEGGQRVITRFAVHLEEDGWKTLVVRHWQLDRPSPR